MPDLLTTPLPPPEPENEAERMAAVARLRFLRNTKDGSLIALATLAAKTLQMPMVAMTVIDGDHEWLITQRGLEGDEFAREDALCAHAILEPGRVMVVPDIDDDPILAGHHASRSGIRFYAGLPITAEGDHPVGTLCVMDRVPRELTPDQEEILGLIGVAVEAAIRRMARLHLA